MMTVHIPDRMLYLTYLQNGGSDHHILRQMYELQLEATALEKNGTKPEQKGRKKSELCFPNQLYPKFGY